MAKTEDLVEELNRKLSDTKIVLDTILEGSLVGYWDWLIQDESEYLNPTFKKMLGYENHELPNHPDSWQKIIHPDDLPGVWDIFKQHVESKGKVPYDNTVRYLHKDGSIVWVYRKGKVIEWDHDGNPIRMVGCHVDITSLKRTQEALKLNETRLVTERNRREEVEKLLVQKMTDQLQEVARQLHDDVAQQLAGLKMMASALNRELKAHSSPHAGDAEEVIDQIQVCISHVRGMMEDLRPLDVGADGLDTAVNTLVANVASVSGVGCHYEGESRFASSHTTTHLYYIAREAIHNAINHGKPNNISVSLGGDEHDFRLRVQDDGVGLPDEPPDGMGIRIMEYRAHLIGATLSIKSTRDSGTLVACTRTRPAIVKREMRE